MTTEDLQNASVDTAPVAETGEAQGTVVENKVDTAPAETTPQIEMVPATEIEKERQKAQMRQNQLENQLEEARKAALEAAQNSGNDELVAKLVAENEALKAEKEREESEAKVKAFETEMDNLFEQTIAGYPDAVKKAARVQKETAGILPIVGDIQYGFEAEKNIKSYLDKLKEGLGDPEPAIKVEAGNLPVQEVQGGIDIAEGPNNVTESELKWLTELAAEDFKKL